MELVSTGTFKITAPLILLDGYTKTTNHLEVATGRSGVYAVSGKLITAQNGITVGID